MWQISFILFGISFCIFAGIMAHDPRTLWSGVSFFWMMVCLAIAMFFLLASYGHWLSSHTVLIWILVILLMAALVCVGLLPAVLVITFFVEGLKVIRHEGRKPANMLSMAFSVMLFGYLAVWPAMGSLGRNLFGTRLYIFISLLAFYVLSLLAIYSLSAVLNLIHLRKRHRADYIIVLGAGLLGDRVTPLLAARIEKGIELLSRNPKAMLILSGGQGPGEDLAEGRAMADYAVQRGVDAGRILVEDKSGSTEENLLFSRELMDGDNPRVILVTTAYHVFRALLLARQQGMKCVGFGAKTKWYFTLNALLREFAGYLSLTWKRHAAAAALMALGMAVIYR
ncbi:MAG: YdcF family protein [Lachnospiraceae bacterium]|nr:YdcF family protein [Lachnospiraceae bacterium]